MSLLLVSIGLLFLLGTLGICVSIWLRAVHLRQLDNVPLSEIEHRHPHIPSLEIIVSLGGCYASFLVILLVALWGSGASTDHAWLLPMCVVLLSGGMSILSELYGQAARLSFMGISLGGVAALSALIVKQADGGIAPWSMILLSLSLLALSLSLLVETRREGSNLHAHHWPVVLTNVFWLLLWLLR